MWGGVTDVINCAKFFENRFREDPEKWHFPLKAFIALTTVKQCCATAQTVMRRARKYTSLF